MDERSERRLLDLAEIEEIKQLKYRYMRHMMLGEIDEMRDLLTPEVKVEYSDGKYSFEGVEAVLAFLHKSHAPEAGLNSTWQLGHPEIEITGADSAKGIWFFNHLAIHKPSGMNIHMASFYRDEYRKGPDRWRISSTGYQRVLERNWNSADLPSTKLEVG